MSNFTRTGKTINGKPVTIDSAGWFRLGDLSATSMSALRVEAEAEAVKTQERKDREKARRAFGGLQINVIDRGVIKPALYRGKDQRSGYALLTVGDEKVNGQGYTLLRLLTDNEVAAYNVLRAEVDAANEAVDAYYARGTMVERWTADTRRVDESEGWQVEIRPYEQRGQRNKADRPEPLHIVAVRFDGATESFAASVTVNGSTVLVTDPILSVVQDKVMAALHPHHGANIVKGDGTISVWEATRYHNDGVLAEGFDVPTYLGYVSAARSARQTRQEWVEARRFVAPAE